MANTGETTKLEEIDPFNSIEYLAEYMWETYRCQIGLYPSPTNVPSQPTYMGECTRLFYFSEDGDTHTETSFYYSNPTQAVREAAHKFVEKYPAFDPTWQK